MMHIPVTIVAKNEANAIGACLDSILVAKRWSERRRTVTLDVLVVLDDCTDDTEAQVMRRGVAIRHSSGGKVEAQRAGLRPGLFCIFIDADVLLAPQTLDGLIGVMLERPMAQVAFPPRHPLPPRAQHRLARVLHRYNSARGFSSQRTWFNGKCFAIRHWRIPRRDELRISHLPADRFYDYAAGLIVDDVYLSRSLLARFGTAAFVENAVGCVYFYAPETFGGMYRYYLRLRRELERVSHLFPEFDAAHARFGHRQADLLAHASWRDRCVYAEFHVWLALCQVRYKLERAYYRCFAHNPCAAWQPILETKCLNATDIPA